MALFYLVWTLGIEHSGHQDWHFQKQTKNDGAKNQPQINPTDRNRGGGFVEDRGLRLNYTARRDRLIFLQN
jgi:hypothetical protein